VRPVDLLQASQQPRTHSSVSVLLIHMSFLLQRSIAHNYKHSGLLYTVEASAANTMGFPVPLGRRPTTQAWVTQLPSYTHRSPST